MKQFHIFTLCILLCLSPEIARSQTGAKAGAKKDAVNVAFKDMSIDKLAVYLGDIYKKPVLPDESIRDKKLTILHKSQMTEKESLQIIQGALLQNGIVIQESAKYIQLLPIDQAKVLQRKLLNPDQAVANEVNDAQIIDKLFQLKYYNVDDMTKIITPMLPGYASIVANKNQSQLMITDSVLNLKRLENLIERLDIAEADMESMRTFKLKYLSPGDVVALLGPIFNATATKSTSSSSSSRQMQDMYRRMEAMRRDPRFRAMMSRSGSSGSQKDQVAAITTGEEGQMILIPDTSRSLLIAVAPKILLDKFERYLKELDQETTEENLFDVYEVKYAQTEGLARQIEDAVSLALPKDTREDFRVVPLATTNQLLVFGPQTARKIAKKMIETLDLENTESVSYEEYMLKYASASTVEQKITDLFSAQRMTYQSMYSRRYDYGKDSNELRVTTDQDRNSVTVFAAKAKLDQIGELIKEWDVPIAIEDVQPKIYKLEYADPLQIKDILDELYADTSASSGFSFFSQSTSTPSNRLAGQFTFQALKNSNKLIVTTTAAENFKVIDQILKELDQAEATGLPQIVELKHANAEELAEQLNALFAERGTRAEIPRADRDLSSISALTTGTQSNNQRTNQNNNNNNNRQNNATPGFLPFWWSQGSQPDDKQEASNLVGEPRIVPVYRRNALMIMAPPAHQKKLKDLIDQLDQPGRQVVIRAIAMEIRHDRRTTVGARIASDPSLFSDPRLVDGAISGTGSFDFTDMFFRDRGVLETSLDLAFLLQLLQRNFQTNIIREPMLYTADNQEATFFDGQDVPYQSASNITSEGNINRSIDYRAVGTQVRVRPHITQDGMVSLQTNIEISRVAPGETVLGNAVFDRIETRSKNIVQSGQTIMISGIVRQENQKDVRKLPGIGDVPGIGKVFGSHDNEAVTRELIIFLTPVVVDDNKDAEKMMADHQKKLMDLRQKMKADFDKLGRSGKVKAKPTKSRSHRPNRP